MASRFLCFLLLLTLAASAAAGRQVPAAAKVQATATSAAAAKVQATDKKVDKECLDQEGSILIPGIGRYMIGSHESIPTFTDLDHSGPAAASGQYIPGNDDTFVPNPGFEVPNPANTAGSITVP